MTWSQRRTLLSLMVGCLVGGCSPDSPEFADEDSGGATGGTAGSGGVAGGTAGSGTSGGAGSGGVDASAGSGGGTSDAGTDSSLPAECPDTLSGPGLVKIETPGGGRYCIDSTEVTNAHYETFLANQPSLSSQPAHCAFNGSFLPGGTGCPDLLSRPDHPVVCVNWCQALAYCTWAGKRLCGKIGGGASGFADIADPTQSQWFNACSSGGANVYPYGDSFEPQTCNGGDYTPIDDAVPVRQASGCHGEALPFSAIYDMSGNVNEWEDSCQQSVGEDDICRLRGGAFGATSNNLRCDNSGSINRSNRGPSIGFRCCADLK